MEHGDTVRARLRQEIRANPGIHFRALQRNLGLAPGQTAHHLNVLEAEGAIVGRRGGRYTHYFAVGAPAQDRSAQAALRLGARRAIACALRDAGSLSLRQVAQATGYAESTVHHHLGVLEAAHAVTHRGERPARWFLAPEAARVLSASAPPAPAASAARA